MVKEEQWINTSQQTLWMIHCRCLADAQLGIPFPLDLSMTLSLIQNVIPTLHLVLMLTITELMSTEFHHFHNQSFEYLHITGGPSIISKYIWTMPLSPPVSPWATWPLKSRAGGEVIPTARRPPHMTRLTLDVDVCHFYRSGTLGLCRICTVQSLTAQFVPRRRTNNWLEGLLHNNINEYSCHSSWFLNKSVLTTECCSNWHQKL